MNRRHSALLLALCVAGLAVAQNRQPSGLPAPRLYVVTPAGAQAGTSVEVTFAGFHLEDATGVVFSHPKIKAEPIAEPPAPIDPKTKKPAMGKPKATPTTVKFKVTVAPDVPVGNHDVRVVNKWGVSNPRVFHVGDLKEADEVEPNNDIDSAPNKPQRVEVNAAVNATFGQPSDVDYYVFKASRGQRVVVSCQATSIDSRARPAIELYDARGRQVGENVSYREDDAVTDVTAPEDGDYFIRVFQFTHTFKTAIIGGLPPGSSDNQYRLAVSTAPWIDAAVPAVIEPGKTAQVTFWGRNLPGGKLDPEAKLDGVVLEKVTVPVTAPADGRGKLTFTGLTMPAGGFSDGFEYRLKNAAGASNPYLIGLAKFPVTVEAADNDTPDKAKPVALPCEVAGVIEKRNDVDWYKFTAKKGDVWNIEVFSEQLGAPTFMTFAVRNPKTKAEMFEAPMEANTNLYPRRFYRRTEDPNAYRFVTPEDGEYEVLVTSRAAGTMFGPRHTYALRIGREEPDFKLVALGEEEYVPSVTTVPVGGSQAFNVIIDRDGDFSEPVVLTVEGLPGGVTCPPQTLAGSVRETTLVVSAAAGAAEWAGPVRVKGTATVAGKPRVREARAASIVWPVNPGNNTPTVSRIDREVFLAVRGKPIFVMTPSLDKAAVLQGDKATCKVKLDRPYADAKAAVQVGVMQAQGRQGSELPNNLRFGNNNQPTAINPGQAEGVFPVTVGVDVPPGTYNVVFRAQSQVPFAKEPDAKTKPNTNAVAVSAPLAITVLPKALATFNVATTSVTAKVGQKTELGVRVTRMYKFDGEFKVKLELPAGVTGVSAAEVTIPAGASEAKLLIDVPAGAALGAKSNLTVKATAMWDGKHPTVHEQKINVNVVK